MKVETEEKESAESLEWKGPKGGGKEAEGEHIPSSSSRAHTGMSHCGSSLAATSTKEHSKAYVSHLLKAEERALSYTLFSVSCICSFLFL